jgi:hypothetical protein
VLAGLFIDDAVMRCLDVADAEDIIYRYRQDAHCSPDAPLMSAMQASPSNAFTALIVPRDSDMPRERDLFSISAMGMARCFIRRGALAARLSAAALPGWLATILPINTIYADAGERGETIRRGRRFMTRPP